MPVSCSELHEDWQGYRHQGQWSKAHLVLVNRTAACVHLVIVWNIICHRHTIHVTCSCQHWTCIDLSSSTRSCERPARFLMSPICNNRYFGCITYIAGLLYKTRWHFILNRLILTTCSPSTANCWHTLQLLFHTTGGMSNHSIDH